MKNISYIQQEIVDRAKYNISGKYVYAYVLNYMCKDDINIWNSSVYLKRMYKWIDKE